MSYASDSYPLIHFPCPSAVQKENKQLCPKGNVMEACPVPVSDFSIHLLTKHKAAEIVAKASRDPAVSAWITTPRALSPAPSTYISTPLR